MSGMIGYTIDLDKSLYGVYPAATANFLGITTSPSDYQDRMKELRDTVMLKGTKYESDAKKFKTGLMGKGLSDDQLTYVDETIQYTYYNIVSFFH